MLFWTIRLAELYLLVGLLFAPAFAFRGAGVVDPVAREGSLGFRLLLLPASAALWPWLLARWIASGRERP